MLYARSASSSAVLTRGICVALSFVAALTFSLWMLLPLVYSSGSEPVSGSTAVVRMLLALAGGVGVQAVTLSLFLAIIVTLTKGANNRVGWSSPGKCTSFGKWMYSSWYFIGSNGMHDGIRFLGFEVAIQGTLR